MRDGPQARAHPGGWEGLVLNLASALAAGHSSQVPDPLSIIPIVWEVSTPSLRDHCEKWLLLRLGAHAREESPGV